MLVVLSRGGPIFCGVEHLPIVDRRRRYVVRIIMHVVFCIICIDSYTTHYCNNHRMMEEVHSAHFGGSSSV